MLQGENGSGGPATWESVRARCSLVDGKRGNGGKTNL